MCIHVYFNPMQVCLSDLSMSSHTGAHTWRGLFLYMHPTCNQKNIGVSDMIKQQFYFKRSPPWHFLHIVYQAAPHHPSHSNYGVGRSIIIAAVFVKDISMVNAAGSEQLWTRSAKSMDQIYVRQCVVRKSSLQIPTCKLKVSAWEDSLKSTLIWMSARYLTFYLTCHLTWSGFVAGILCGILSNILSDLLSDTGLLSSIQSGILSGTISDILWHSIWHSIWQSFWHSIWHFTWHSDLVVAVRWRPVATDAIETIQSWKPWQPWEPGPWKPWKPWKPSELWTWKPAKTQTKDGPLQSRPRDWGPVAPTAIES